ncbi:ABC transporter permease [Saccharothrix sp. MB29]|nr:ABC transporter permease [Saccharothrix sp. MB29]
MSAMRHALLIAAKDLRERSRDRSVLLYALLLPLGLTLLLNLVLGGVTDPRPFRYAVVDDDRGPVAAAFADALRGAQDGGAVEVRPAGSADEARRLVDAGDVAAAFLLPAGLSSDLAGGRAASVEVVGDVDAPLGTRVAASIARSFTDRLTSVRVAVEAARRGGSSVDPAELARLVAAEPDPLPVVEDPAPRRELDPTTYYAAGMAVFFLFFSVQFGVTSLLDERRDGTLARLLAAPLRPSSILVGKLLTSCAIGLVSMGVLVVATSLAIGAHWGPPVGVALLVVSGVLAATGLVAVVASVARTAEQASGWQAVLAVALGALGGTFIPIAQVGGPLAAVSLASPHRWFLAGLADLAADGVTGVWPSVTALLVFALVGFGVAGALTRRAVRW